MLAWPARGLRRQLLQRRQRNRYNFRASLGRMKRGNERRAELAVEADEPPICWPGAEAPAPACATASRPLQSLPPNASSVAATVAPRRCWHAGRSAAYLQRRWADIATARFSAVSNSSP